MTEKPLFTPQTEWTVPIIFPDLRDRKEISIDLETKDPFLKSHGINNTAIDFKSHGT